MGLCRATGVSVSGSARGDDTYIFKASSGHSPTGPQEGDFDYFTVDLAGHRLFLTAEKNSAVEVFDLNANKLIHTITELDEPHSMLYRADLKKLFGVDGGAAEVRMYDSDSYKYLGGIKLKDHCDSLTYDSATKYLYVAARA